MIKKQKAIAIFHNGGHKIFEFQGHNDFIKLQKQYGSGKVINNQTVKQFIVYEDKEQKKYSNKKMVRVTQDFWVTEITYAMKSNGYDSTDKVAMRTIGNDLLDQYEKSGMITRKQSEMFSQDKMIKDVKSLMRKTRNI